MQGPPDGVSVGDQLSQAEIESAFDTGFGYQISGINPRRDARDQQYILLFANENGPYSDSVTEGEFEYVGEGLEGDQSESSPGNSTLIDAIDSAIPIHFFYKRSEAGQWEYQGRVDALDYEFRERDGRDVIVFTLKHRHVSREGDGADLSWLDAVRLELQRYRDREDTNIVTLEELYDFSESRLSARFPENDNVRAKIRQTLQRLRDQGQVTFLDEPATYQFDVADDVHREKTELERALDSEPTLESDTQEYTRSRRRARDYAFAAMVKEVYDDTCAVCGSSRETPTGNPEVEAAHIYPKHEGGADDIRNGLALCKLHHWAFDSGWFSITDAYEIVVEDAPERDGYFEFKQLEGDRLTLPEDDRARPHPQFLAAHRNLHGF